MSTKDSNWNTKKTIILDVDVGTDDAWTIFLALSNEKLVNYEVKAITCVFGNTDLNNVGKNVLRVLSTVNRLDVPVYVGCNEPFVMDESKDGYKQSSFHGTNGLCDFEFDSDPDTSIIKQKHAVHALYDTVMSDPNVVLLCLGPLTNIAMLFKMYPEARNKFEAIYVMGGNRHGMGNITRCAEFNFFADPEAAHIFFQTVQSPVKLVPIETLHLSTPVPLSWRFDELGSVKNKIVNFMNPIERKAYDGVYNQWLPYDAFTIACFLDPSIAVKSEKYHITIELGGLFTRGQVVVDHKKQRPHNVEIIEEVDIEKFKTLITKLIQNTQ